MSTKNLLVELFVEELPPKALKKLGESFSATLAARLKASGLVDETTVTPFASPRRLAVQLAAQFLCLAPRAGRPGPAGELIRKIRARPRCLQRAQQRSLPFRLTR